MIHKVSILILVKVFRPKIVIDLKIGLVRCVGGVGWGTDVAMEALLLIP